MYWICFAMISSKASSNEAIVAYASNESLLLYPVKEKIKVKIRSRCVLYIISVNLRCTLVSIIYFLERILRSTLPFTIFLPFTFSINVNLLVVNPLNCPKCSCFAPLLEAHAIKDWKWKPAEEKYGEFEEKKFQKNLNRYSSIFFFASFGHLSSLKSEVRIASCHQYGKRKVYNWRDIFICLRAMCSYLR